jgi:DNA-binding response OmpR family regulator
MESSAPILLVEDEENDVFLFRQALALAGVERCLVVAGDGLGVVDYFAPPAPGSNALPGVIVLDLNMPRMDGFQVLAWLATQPRLRSIPVVVLSSSDDEGDQAKARLLGATEYWVKPFNFDELVHMARELASRYHSASRASQPRAGPEAHRARPPLE